MRGNIHWATDFEIQRVPIRAQVSRVVESTEAVSQRGSSDAAKVTRELKRVRTGGQLAGSLNIIHQQRLGESSGDRSAGSGYARRFVPALTRENQDACQEDTTGN